MVVPRGHYRFGPQNSRLILHTGRQGLAGSLGHDLTLEVTSWSAEVDVGADLSSGRVSARIDLASLTVVDGRGGAMPLRAGDRREIELNSRKALQVDRFPEGTFESTTISEAAGGLVVEGVLTIHGRSVPQQVVLEETASNRYRGHGAVVQSQFGIKPYTAMFGALKVRDDVDFEVEADVEASLEP
jgi:polyisoprenoid-binding protein YceI